MSRDYRSERLIEMKPSRLRQDLEIQLLGAYGSGAYQLDRVVVEYSSGPEPIWVLCHEVIPNFPLGVQNPRLLGKWILPTSVSAGEWIQGTTIEEQERETAEAIEVERKRHQLTINFAAPDPVQEIRATWPEISEPVWINQAEVEDISEDPRLFIAVDLPLWLAIWRANDYAEHFCPEELVTLFTIVEGQAADNEGDSREVQEMWSCETYVENWKSVTKQEIEDVSGRQFEDALVAADWVGGYIVHHDNGPSILVNAEDFGQLAEQRMRDLLAGGEA